MMKSPKHLPGAPLRIGDATLNRRRFLRGLGACIALPALESLGAQPAPDPVGQRLATGQTGAPLRMAFLYFPNGVNQEHWWPKGEGAEFELGQTMESLAALKHRVQILGGLEHRHATAGNDGAGDHARANGTFLTGVRVKKTAGADIRAGVSIDQVAAEQVGHLTRFPSLELTCDSVRRSGNCDSGYSCAYQHNLSWRSPTMPMPPEPNPRQVFERLFGAGSASERAREQERRLAQQKSILDFVLEDAHTLEKQLTGRDRQKLDEYLTSVREVEKQLDQADRFEAVPAPTTEIPDGIPRAFQEHVRVMYRMLVLAFQTDSTRLATFLLAGDGNNRAYPNIGVPEGHHSISHHQNNREMMEKIAKIDQWYVEQLAWFLGELESVEDTDGQSLLQNCMIVYGCGNSDGNRHTHHNLPVILAGGGGGSLTPDRYVKLPRMPMSNLFLSLADRLGVPELDRFGDSTGRVSNLTS